MKKASKSAWVKVYDGMGDSPDGSRIFQLPSEVLDSFLLELEDIGVEYSLICEGYFGGVLD